MTKLAPIGMSGSDIKVIFSPKAYKQQLLWLISHAKKRIYIAALYLQDDNAGREILHAIYQAKIDNPTLDVKIFVDYHRAQRGLIGEKNGQGNRGLYLALAKQYQEVIEIYGVAVKGKELLGVLHLKGMVFDNIVLYSGASINDVYLHQETRYRLDRYYQFSAMALADSFCDYLQRTFVDSGFCPRLNIEILPSKQQQKRNIAHLKTLIKKSSFDITTDDVSTEIKVQPYVGCGSRNNTLNNAIRQVIQQSQDNLLIFTPYFNLPKPLAKDLVRALKRGVKVVLVIGDKTANDFYIADENEFTTIGIVPYLYEMLLLRFIKRWQRYIDSGLLEVRLWQDQDNSFHLKGLVADDRFHLLTGNNLNPRAWTLDLENGLLIDDIHGYLMPALTQEKEIIFQHTQIISHYKQMQKIKDYPEKPRKLLKKIQITQIDRILKRFL